MKKTKILKILLFFLQDFLESEGIEVNPSELSPSDPYIVKRKEAAALRTFDTPSSFDKLKQFIELDRKVLRFFCVWDDSNSMFGETRPFVIHVSTVNLNKRNIYTLYKVEPSMQIQCFIKVIFNCMQNFILEQLKC